MEAPVTPARGTILLVQAVDYDSRTLTGFQPLCTPLSIATIAALTPEGYEVDLWDENLDGLIDATTLLPRARYDIVGISTLFEQVGHRVPTLARLFRDRGSYICAGGPGISNQLNFISACVDSVFQRGGIHLAGIPPRLVRGPTPTRVHPDHQTRPGR